MLVCDLLHFRVRKEDFQVPFCWLAQVCIVLAFLLIPLFSSGQTSPFHWTGRLTSEQKLAVLDVTGSVVVESVEGDTLEVTATIASDEQNRVHVEVMENNNAVSFCAIYANAPGASASMCRAGEGRWCRNECDGLGPRVDFTVRLPRNVRTLDVAGVNTSITGYFGKQEWPGEMNIRTVSGNIELQLSANASVAVEIVSPVHHLHSEFPLTLRPEHRPGRIRGTIGKGDSKLRLSTVSGNISLKKAG